MNDRNLDITYVRQQFPSLHKGFVFMDNAGGSQIAGQVINRIHEYFLKYNVQLGASYRVSAEAGEALKEVTRRMAVYLNASRAEEIVFGPSTTMLLRILSLTLSRQWSRGDEVIITNSDHEANRSCWTDLQRNGIIVKHWEINPDTLTLEIEDLRALLSNKTRLVAMVHASNVLATVNPLREVAEVVHTAGALLCVDGVAWAPHRLVDVSAYGVDFYVFSTYKVYGPHQAVLFGKYELLGELEGINHYFIGKEEVPYKLQPGNINFELTYGLGGLFDYFDDLHRHHFEVDPGTAKERQMMVFGMIARHEEELAYRLLSYLNGRSDIRIIGLEGHEKERRLPTISFVHDTLTSDEVVRRVDPYEIGIRYGDFYARKLIEYLGLTEKNGVVRVSLVHYNTPEEVDGLIRALDSEC